MYFCDFPTFELLFWNKKTLQEPNKQVLGEEVLVDNAVRSTEYDLSKKQIKAKVQQKDL